MVLSTLNDLKDSNNPIETSSIFKIDELRLGLLNALKRPNSEANDKIVFSNISLKLSTLAEESRRAPKVEGVLNSLRFTEMKVRHSDIKEAHAETFR